MSLTNLVLLQNSALLGPAGQAIPVDIQCELGKVNFMYFFTTPQYRPYYYHRHIFHILISALPPDFSDVSEFFTRTLVRPRVLQERFFPRH